MTNTVVNSDSIPSFPSKHWFNLRKQFQKTMPKDVTPQYLASVLEMQENSAKDNILRPMKMLGLVSADGKPTDLANRWRHDEDYKEVCVQILENIYPQELKDIFHTPNPDDIQRIKGWFSRNLSVRDGAAGKMASFFLLLSDADLSKVDDLTRNRHGESTVARKQIGRAAPVKRLSSKGQKAFETPLVNLVEKNLLDHREAPEVLPEKAKLSKSLNPSLHIDLQIHISPESSTEQIDAIFSSMAKYFKVNDED